MSRTDSIADEVSSGNLISATVKRTNFKVWNSRSISRRILLLSALGAMVVPKVATAHDSETLEQIPRSPLQTDQHVARHGKFSVQEYDWLDQTRRRDVPVRVYLPNGVPEQSEGWPLVVFSHGIGGSRRGYSYIGSYLAAQGIIALHVQHVGSDRELWFGNPFTMVSRLQDAAREKEAIARVHDIRFALDNFLHGESGALVDEQRVIAAGHSYGANTTMLLAGARVARNGEELKFRDPRIKAAVIISAPPFYGESEPSAVLGGVTIPTLHITATEDVINIPGYHSPATDRIKVFDATGSTTKALVVFQGGSHSIFTDRAVTGGTSLNPKVKLATREIVAEFASKVFMQDEQSFEIWRAKHQELMAQWVFKRPNANLVERDQVSAEEVKEGTV